MATDVRTESRWTSTLPALGLVLYAEDNIGSLDLMRTTVPLIGFIGGGVALIAGLLLALRGGGPQQPAPASRREPVSVG
jgi:hypothetical protein